MFNPSPKRVLTSLLQTAFTILFGIVLTPRRQRKNHDEKFRNILTLLTFNGSSHEQGAQGE